MHPGHGVVFHEVQLVEQAMNGGCVRSVYLGIRRPVPWIDTCGVEALAEVICRAPLAIPILTLPLTRKTLQEEALQLVGWAAALNQEDADVHDPRSRRLATEEGDRRLF